MHYSASEGENVRSFAAVREGGATRVALPGTARRVAEFIGWVNRQGFTQPIWIFFAPQCVKRPRRTRLEKESSGGGGAVEVLLLSRDLMAMVEPADRGGRPVVRSEVKIRLA